MTIRKGEIRNPLGKNGKKPISEALKALVTRSIDDPLNDKPKTIAQQIALDLVRDALNSDNKLPAQKEIFDRIEGKPAQAIIGGDQDDPPIRITPLTKADEELLKRYLTKEK